jgi:hypothetical protein
MLLPYYGLVFSMVCLVWVVDVDGVWLHACCVWCCVVVGCCCCRRLLPDARFSFPDRRHSSLSEVYPGVSVPYRLISCPPSFLFLRSVSRSASPSRQDQRANLICECFPPKRAGEFNIRIRGLVSSYVIFVIAIAKIAAYLLQPWHPLNPVVPVPPAKKSRRRRSKQ